MFSQQTFCTAINCMDGRTQLPVNQYLKKKYGVDYVDTITEPGPVKILAEGEPADLINSINNRILISTEKHGSKVVAVVGHVECAGNPVSKDVQLVQLQKAKANLAQTHSGIEIILLWVNDNWEVEEVT